MSGLSEKKALAPLGLASFLFSAASVSAEAAEATRDVGVYLRGGAGLAFGETLDQDLAYNPAAVFPVTPASSKSTDLGDGLALSGAIGFQYARTRTELEYRRIVASVDSVAYAGGAAPGPAVVNDDLTAQALMSNVYFDFVNASMFTPYIGVGVGGARVENELGERDAAFAYQGRAGVEIDLGGALSIGAEYVYFRTVDVEYGPKEFDPAGPAGPRTNGAPFVASSVMGTVRVQF